MGSGCRNPDKKPWIIWLTATGLLLLLTILMYCISNRFEDTKYSVVLKNK